MRVSRHHSQSWLVTAGPGWHLCQVSACVALVSLGVNGKAILLKLLTVTPCSSILVELVLKRPP